MHTTSFHFSGIFTNRTYTNARLDGNYWIYDERHQDGSGSAYFLGHASFYITDGDKRPVGPFIAHIKVYGSNWIIGWFDEPGNWHTSHEEPGITILSLVRQSYYKEFPEFLD